MADEIVGGALDLVMNPVRESDADGEGKQEMMVTCPGLSEFGCMSRLLRLLSFGAARKLSLAVPFLASVLFLVKGPLEGEKISANDLSFAGVQVALFLLGCTTPLCNRAIVPGGPLEQLGLGSRDISVADRDSFHWWAKVLAVLALPFWAFALFFVIMFVFFFLMQGMPITFDAMVFMVPGITGCLVNIPCLLAWWFSLKIASVLAEDTVRCPRRSHCRQCCPSNLRRRASAAQIDDVIELIREHGVQSEKWNALVIPAVHGLVKTTLPMLSAGWGISLGLVFAAAVPASFSYVNLYLWWGGVYSVVMAVAIPLRS